MRPHRVLLLTTALSGVLLWGYAGSAAAQSMTTPTEVSEWSGLYLGGTLGYGWGKSGGTVNWDDNGGDIAAILSGTSDPLPVLADDAIINFPEPGQAYFGGFHAGYMTELNSLLLGVEADIVFATAVREGTLTESGSLTTSTTILSSVFNYLTTLTPTTTSTQYSYFSSQTTYTSQVTSTQATSYNASTTTIYPYSTFTNYSSSLTTYSTDTMFLTTLAVTTTGSTLLSLNTTTSPVTGPWQSTVSGRATIDWMSTIKARMGVAMGPAMAYLAGGVAYGQVTTSLTAHLDVNGTEYDWTGANTEQRFGYVVGAGIAQKLDANWSARLEGSYFDLGEASVTANADGAPASATDVTGTYKQKVDGFVVNLGLDYQF